MPTNANTYNSRITDEELEARFRQTFRSQGETELVDDLYASGVIVPVVDFTAAAEGSALPKQLQEAWDFTTGHQSFNNSSGSIITNSGFWQLGINSFLVASAGTVVNRISLSDGISSKVIFEANASFPSRSQGANAVDDKLVVFLRAGDSVSCLSSSGDAFLDVWYRQIATVNGTLVNPTGFSFS